MQDNPYILRGQSRIKNKFECKMSNFKLLSDVLIGQPWLDISSCLFGYLLPHFDLSTSVRALKFIKKQFQSMKESLTVYKQLKPEDAVMIVCDLILKIQKQKQNYSWRPEDISYFMYQTIAGMIHNKKYIVNSWEQQDIKEIQRESNQTLIRKMLQEEAAQRKRIAMQEEAKGWECQICICEIDPSMMGILQCGHIFHPQCLNGYLQAQIQSNQLDIKCPFETCKQSLPPNDIFNYIDGGLREKYENFSFNKFVEMNTGNISWCPTAGCTAVFEFDEALDNYKCPACKKHYCLKCRCQYHTGMSCAEYRITNSFDKNDEKFLDFVKGAKFKQCPKCNFWVERNKGCSTMKCKCGQEFCYDCGGTGCPHGSCSKSGRKK